MRRGASSGSAGSIVTTPRAVAINAYHAHTSGNDERRRRSTLGDVRRGLRVDAACFAPDIITINISSAADECLVENVFGTTNPAREMSLDTRETAARLRGADRVATPPRLVVQTRNDGVAFVRR